MHHSDGTQGFLVHRSDGDGHLHGFCFGRRDKQSNRTRRCLDVRKSCIRPYARLFEENTESRYRRTEW